MCLHHNGMHPFSIQLVDVQLIPNRCGFVSACAGSNATTGTQLIRAHMRMLRLIKKEFDRSNRVYNSTDTGFACTPFRDDGRLCENALQVLWITFQTQHSVFPCTACQPMCRFLKNTIALHLEPISFSTLGCRFPPAQLVSSSLSGPSCR